MNDHARALVEHLRYKGSVQPDCRKEILIEGMLPLAIVERGKASPGSRGTADDMDDNIDAAELVRHGVRDAHAAFSRGEICRHEQLSWGNAVGPRARSSEDSRSGFAQSRSNGRTYTLRTAGDERTLTGEIATVAHHRTSSMLIRPSAAKPKR
jgi:hypothetical protein